MIKFNIIVPNDITNKFNKSLNKNLNIAKQKIIKKLQSYARANHRYVSRTGNLKRSTYAKEIKDESLLNIELGIDEAKADYGKYVVRPHGSWAGDQFITKAIKENMIFINDTLDKAVSAAVREFNG